MAAAAVSHGSRTGRWQTLPPIGEYTARLAAVPMTAGDWTGRDIPLADAESLPAAGIAGHLHRQYVHKTTGEAVTVLMVCGRPGPISVHTPDVCYASAGYRAIGSTDAAAVDLPGKRVTCSRLRFKPPAGRVEARDLDIRWAWCAGDGVETPNSPRISFSGKPALYKLYVIREVQPSRPGAAPTTPAAGADPAEQFLKVFIPPMEAAIQANG